MHLILKGLVQAFELLFRGDPVVYRIALRTLQVSVPSIVVALLIGVPAAAAVALTRFRGRHLVISLINTGMAWPPVVIGLIVALFLWRSGPLGFLDLIYTVRGMIIAQVLIATPIVTGLSLAALQQLDPGFRLQIQSFGAGRLRLMVLLVREIRIPILAATMAGFGRIIAEVGAATIVGGNIAGQTQVLTTAIVQHTNAGDFAGAIALGVILLLLAFVTNFVMTTIQQRSNVWVV
jgi:tungstate transport system permease protein